MQMPQDDTINMQMSQDNNNLKEWQDTPDLSAVASEINRKNKEEMILSDGDEKLWMAKVTNLSAYIDAKFACNLNQ